MTNKTTLQGKKNRLSTNNTGAVSPSGLSESLPLATGYSALIFTQAFMKDKGDGCFLSLNQAPTLKRIETPRYQCELHPLRHKKFITFKRLQAYFLASRLSWKPSTRE